MKKKNLIALGLAVLMAFSTFAGCAGEEKEAESAVTSTTEEKEETAETAEPEETEEASNEIVFPLEETMEFTMMNTMNSEYKLAEAPAFIKACEMANFKFDQTEFVAAEAVEKANMLIASGDYPEIFFKIGVDYDGLGMDGILIPLEDMIREYMPNLTAILDERDAWNNISAPDGHVYSLPQINITQTYMAGWQLWYNKQWADNLGIEDPKSMDEMYAMLKAFADEDANGNGDPDDEIPFCFSNNGPGLNCLLQYMTDGMHDYSKYTAIMDGELKFYPLTEEFKENYLQLLVNMYKDGILDPNGYTQTYQQVQAIGNSSDVYGMVINGAAGSQISPEIAYQFHAITPFWDQFPLSKGVNAGGAGISDKCENPEVFLAWMDYFYTEEGGRLADQGIEGVNYEVTEDGKLRNLTDYDVTPSGSFAIGGTCTAPFRYPDLRYNYEVTDEKYAHGDYQRYFRPQEYGVIMPDIINTEEEQEQIADLRANIIPYINNYIAQVVVGEMDLDATWQEFQDTIKDMGAEELQSIYQAGYERGQSE